MHQYVQSPPDVPGFFHGALFRGRACFVLLHTSRRTTATTQAWTTLVVFESTHAFMLHLESNETWYDTLHHKRSTLYEYRHTPTHKQGRPPPPPPIPQPPHPSGPPALFPRKTTNTQSEVIDFDLKMAAWTPPPATLDETDLRRVQNEAAAAVQSARAADGTDEAHAKRLEGLKETLDMIREGGAARLKAEKEAAAVRVFCMKLGHFKC